VRQGVHSARVASDEAYVGSVGRPQREFVAGAVYHVYARGSNRQAIFTYDFDRIDFLSCLSRVVGRTRLSCLAYCLMSNHYHLVLHTHDGELSRGMHALNGGYANRFNRRHQRDAHLFRNRFGAVRQETQAQLEWTLRYVAVNPVAKGLCSTPEEWPWSSYRASVGIDPAPRFLDVHGLMSLYGDTLETAVARFRASVEQIVGV
jgi:putative transposase